MLLGRFTRFVDSLAVRAPTIGFAERAEIAEPCNYQNCGGEAR